MEWQAKLNSRGKKAKSWDIKGGLSLASSDARKDKDASFTGPKKRGGGISGEDRGQTDLQEDAKLRTTKRNSPKKKKGHNCSIGREVVRQGRAGG